MDFETKPGRLFEVLIGSVTLIIACSLSLLAILMLLQGKFTIFGLAVIASLVLMACWFGTIAYRLILHKARDNGSLLSVFALKIWCVFFGVSSIILLMVGFSESHLGLVIIAVIMLTGCLFGWQLALKRQ
ncbi:MAG: hypothetical protein HWE26_06690 [Alteromonadaceae bacterium]|nr:hypothetical protein [Alteromonadaceae bacterium]